MKAFTSFVLLFIFGISLSQANTAQKAIDTAASTHKRGASSQQRIDKDAAASKQLRDAFLTTTLKTEKLKVYVKQVEALLETAETRKADLERQKQALQGVEQDVLPLMQSMVAALAEFVSLDLPFKADERVARVETMQALLKDPQVPVASQFRQILEAWQTELDYGQAIGAWRQELMLGSSTRTVDFLHIGRVAVFYQTLNGQESGRWNPQRQRWDVLSPSYGPAIRRGIRMAREQAAPDVLELPIPTAGRVQ